MWTSDMLTIEQIKFWDNHIYPIYTRAKSAFRDWIDYVAPKTRTNKLKSLPVSDITFSILDGRDTVNASRFAIGTFYPTIEDYELFNSIARYLTRRSLFIEPDKSILLLGIGEDLQAKEDKFYIYIRNPWNKKITIVARTYKDGKLVERKIYQPIKKGFKGTGKRGIRKQINYELSGKKAINFLKKLPISERARVLGIKVLQSGLFDLDTVSYSKERGIALYFD